ncbi:MAG: PleD family two-component system response regulator [Candidatus Hodarchaeota archaeon]
MEEFKINNQAHLIRNFVDNNIDYINIVAKKNTLDHPIEYDEKYYYEFISNAIDVYEEGNGFYEELKQKLSPLKLSILMLENRYDDRESMLEVINNIKEALEGIEESIKHHFEEPNIVRFVKKIDVLYIEDNELERKTIDTFFSQKGINIKSVETSEEALYLLKILTPRVILVDINLKTSNINGDKFCQIIKTKSEYNAIPVILISAIVSKDKKQDILTKLGAEDIIIKPIDRLSDLHILFKYLKQY